MRRLIVLFAFLALAAPAGSILSPAAVVRAWSKALNRNDNEAAGSLFAPNAIVTQPGYRLILKTHKLAVEWNSGLPCSGTITFLEVKGNTVRANFLLGQRPKHKCDAPRTPAAALFRIRNGKITFWQQIPPLSSPTA
jgi:hypothetical protein